jgi:ribosomal protein S18 acetylase RimI-like enzyme
MYVVRQLSASDRIDFRHLRQTALTVNPDEFIMTSEEEQAVPRLEIEALLEKPEPCNCFLGVFTDDPAELVAIGGLLRSGLRKTRHVGRITSVFVHPRHRRRGLARQIVGRLLSQAQEAGLRTVRLEVVAENREAVSLYERLGFVSYGREPAAYRLDERHWDLLLMTRDVA